MTLQWVSADLLSGGIVGDLPSFDPTWPLRRTISQAETATGTLHLAGAPENWERAIREGGALLACYDDTPNPDGSQPKPIQWCGYVPASGPLDAASDDVPVNMATYEAMLDRAFVGDTTYLTTQHRDDIIADLITSWWAPGTGISYLQLNYTPGGGPTPALMDQPPVPNAAIVMQNTDNATVLTRIQQVIAQLGGEFTIDWAWSDDGESLVPTMSFGDRIGRAATAGLDPPVTFELPGQLVTFQQSRSYAAGDGANKIVPYSTGQGNTTPYAAPILTPADGRPTFEYRYQPAPSLSPSALAQYGQQASPILAPGKRPVTLVASTARLAGRRLGVDWGLGDDIGYNVRSPYTNAQGETVTIRAFPRGVKGVARAIGYELTDTTVAPTLADPQIYTEIGV